MNFNWVLGVTSLSNTAPGEQRCHLAALGPQISLLYNAPQNWQRMVHRHILLLFLTQGTSLMAPAWREREGKVLKRWAGSGLMWASSGTGRAVSRQS